MSESQFVRKIEPQIKKSTLDGHQLLTAPPRQRGAVVPAQPTHKTRPGGTTATPTAAAPTPGTDVVITSKQPIDARMQPGGVVVKAPTAAPTPIAVQSSAVRPAQTAVRSGGHARGAASPVMAPAPAIVIAPPFAGDELELLISLVDHFGQTAGGEQREIASRVFAKLHAMAK
jgi:hypothetical protein